MNKFDAKILNYVTQFYKDNPIFYQVFIDNILILSIGLFVFFLLLLLAITSFNKLSLIGVPDDLIKTAQKEFKQKNEKLTFGHTANLDNPTKKILLNRYFYHYADRIFTALLLISILIVAIDIITLTFIIKSKFFIKYFLTDYALYYFIGSVILAYIFSRLIYFFLVRDLLINKGAKVNKELLGKRKKMTTSEGELSDARTLKFKEKINFDPVSYFKLARENDSVFLGIDENNKPLLIPRRVWKKSNIQIMGAVGSGKGVLACTALAQCMANFNDCVIVFDPKDDEWAPHVLRRHAEDFLLIDLRQGKAPQLNIFNGLTPYQLNELLVAGFSLGRRGDNADFYRDNDRQAVRYLSNMFKDGEEINVNSLLRKSQELPKEIKDNAKGFFIVLQELCSLSVLQTAIGADLKKFILKGGCIYIKGSLRDETVIMLQKMLFVRCLQIIEERDRYQETTHVNIFLDEFKYLLSKSSLEALGTVRDKNCNILLSHQSLGDFGQCGADISEKTASATVVDNTTIKWIYRMKDFKSAEWASKQTGEILVDSERRNMTTSSGNVEMSGISTTKFKEKRFLIDINTIQHLPEGTAVLIGHETAKLAYSNPISVERKPIDIMTFPLIDNEILPKFFNHDNVVSYEPPKDDSLGNETIPKNEVKYDEDIDQWR